MKRVLRAESAAAAGTVAPCPRSSVKGWAKVWLLSPPEERSVSLIDDLGRPGQLQARGQAGGVALRERGRGVHPGAGVGLEAGGAQHLVAPVHLGADFVGDARLGERDQVDGHVGLVEHLVAAERSQLVERVLAAVRACAAAERAHRQRAHGERGRHVVVRRHALGHGGHAAGRDRDDDADAQRTALADMALGC